MFHGSVHHFTVSSLTVHTINQCHTLVLIIQQVALYPFEVCAANTGRCLIKALTAVYHVGQQYGIDSLLLCKATNYQYQTVLIYIPVQSGANWPYSSMYEVHDTDLSYQVRGVRHKKHQELFRI